MINLRAPANGPLWLPAFASSIVAAFKAIMAAPFRLWDVATADLPPAADWAQGLIYDATTDTIKYSDGTNWIELKSAALFVLKAGDTMTGPLILADDVNAYLRIGRLSNPGPAYIQPSANATNLSIQGPAGNVQLEISDLGVASLSWLKPANYTVATVPSAATSGAGAMLYVSDEIGGAVPAFSDGSTWRRVTDRAVIS